MTGQLAALTSLLSLLSLSSRAHRWPQLLDLASTWKCWWGCKWGNKVDREDYSPPKLGSLRLRHLPLRSL